MARSSLAFAVFFAGCAAEPGSVSESLGNRLRVRIEGRGQEKSITTADYFLYLMFRCPDGTLAETRIYAPEFAESEGMSLDIGTHIERYHDPARVRLEETLHGDPRCCHDIVLPAGVSISFEPGSYFAYRIVDHTRMMRVDRDAEIRLGMITADGSRYVEVESADGPPIERATDPPGWQLAGARK